MSATKNEIKRWFDRGVAQGDTHMIVVCDTFNYDDYPVFVKVKENSREIYEKYNGKDMQRVIEVYSMSRSKDDQMAERRSFHFD